MMYLCFSNQLCFLTLNTPHRERFNELLMNVSTLEILGLVVGLHCCNLFNKEGALKSCQNALVLMKKV